MLFLWKELGLFYMLIASTCFLGTERFSKNKDACFNLFLYKNKENRLRFVSLPKSQFGLAQRT